ncbi:PREDICTED: la-related protein 1B-like [Nelumbo nucifera]|uniref:La-related protein 1B-like n=1 Tax=Nelumbo nucifera TaxID=4432 RepID=A0A1U8ANA3_NELNU|nr:PREDICTED: la-related protein 1B-like [Nelumbo nucifera]
MSSAVPSSSLPFPSQSVVLGPTEIFSNTQDSAINPHPHPHHTCTNNNPWKRVFEPPRSSQTAFVMNTSSWPALSRSSSPKAPPEVQLPESSSKEMIAESKGINGGLVSADIASATVSSSDNESSSSANLKLSVSVSGDGCGSGSEKQKVTPSPSSTKSMYSRPGPANSSRPFNHHNNQHHHHSSRMGSNQRGNGFNTRGGNRGGDGFHHNQNYSNRRHQPRGFSDWNSNRGFSPRAVNPQHPPHGFVNGPAGFLGPPPPPPPPLQHSYPPTAIVNPPYVNVPPPPPPPVPAYMPPYGYYGNGYFPDASGPVYGPPMPPPAPFMEAVNGPPLYPQPSPPYNLPNPEVELCNRIQKQIEYYFSAENLVNDFYLRGEMNNEGWVPISLIAGFRRVKAMTSDVSMIMKSLKISSIVEVKDNKVRKRGDWMNWILSRRSMSATQTCSVEDMLGAIKDLQLTEKPEAESQEVASKIGK